MTDFWPGQRIRITNTANPESGGTGTVRLYDAARHLLMVAFDNGTYGPLILDDTHVEALPTEATVREWDQIWTAVYAVGLQHGQRAAGTWARHTFAGRSTADTVFAAHTVLEAIAGGDPDMLDTLPQPPEPGATFGRDVFTTAATGTTRWETLNSSEREEVQQSYRTGFEGGLTDRVRILCEDLLNTPRSGSLFLRALGDDVGAAAPAWTRHAARGRYAMGFAAVLHYQAGDDIVFGCTRSVAEAIAAELRRHHGISNTDGPGHNDGVLYRDDDTSVISEEHLMLRPAGLDALDTSDEPEYHVRTRAAAWSIVAPDRCDRVVGDLAERQLLVDSGPLPSPSLQVPHRDLRIVRLRPPLVPPGSIFTAAILWHGTPAGGLHGWGTPDLGLYLSDPDVLTESTLRRYLNDCRLGGQPVTETQALRALADEALLCDAIDEAYAIDGTLLRQTDTAGYTLLCRQITPVPAGPAGVQQLSDRITRHQPHERWHIWTGRRWLILPHPAPAPARAL